MRGRKGRFLFTIFLVVLVFGLGTRIVDAAETVPVVRAEEDNTETALIVVYIVHDHEFC